MWLDWVSKEKSSEAWGQRGISRPGRWGSIGWKVNWHLLQGFDQKGNIIETAFYGSHFGFHVKSRLREAKVEAEKLSKRWWSINRSVGMEVVRSGLFMDIVWGLRRQELMLNYLYGMRKGQEWRMSPGVGTQQLEGVVLSFTQQIFNELLLSAKHCLAIWNTSVDKTESHSQGNYSIDRENRKQTTVMLNL